MSDAEKMRSWARIVDTEARLFRENGIGATSLSDVMVAAGMTHGGFYRHFPSREALVEAAFAKAADDQLSGVEQAENAAAWQAALRAYIARYLSLGHVRSAGLGCPIATLGAEVAKLNGPAAEAVSDAVARTAAVLDDGGDGVAMLALLVGTVNVARLATSDADAARIIAAGHAALAAMRAGET
ncbi:MAG: helix-turn-helix domain-containing protein [Pseudomonadota bacterium]